MTATGTEVAADAPPEQLALDRPRRRRWWVVSGLVLLLGAATVGVVVTDPFRAAAKKAGDGPAATSLATVNRQSLRAQTQVDGTLGYAGSYTVLNRGHGTITWLPGLGTVIRQGGVLYRLDGEPVLLLYGRTPAYRDLAEGATADDVTGPDVRQLNAALVALGYATTDQLDPTSDEFGWETKAAVKRLQADHGLEETGRLALGSVVFLPRALRVATEPLARGATAPPGATVLTGTSTRRIVSVDLDVAQQGQVRRGDPVTVTLPDNTTTPGVVTAVGKVATTPSGGNGGDGNSSPTVEVTVTLRRPAAAGSLDQAPVLVGIVTAHADGVLVVPVTALLALAGGGCAVEVAGAGGARHLVAVTLGLFDGADGLVQVSGTGLSAGQRVVVPSS